MSRGTRNVFMGAQFTRVTTECFFDRRIHEYASDARILSRGLDQRDVCRGPHVRVDILAVRGATLMTTDPGAPLGTTISARSPPRRVSSHNFLGDRDGPSERKTRRLAARGAS